MEESLGVELDRTRFENLLGVELVPMTSPEGDRAVNVLAEVGVRESKTQS